MARDTIVLFDLPCKQGNICWSPNVWKTRLILNYKGIPYQSEWIDFPDIEPTLAQHGAGPQQTQALGAAVGAKYTLPAIRTVDGRIVMDSKVIVGELEQSSPRPPLHLELGLDDEAQSILREIAWPLYPEIAPLIRDALLTEHGKAHWVDAREKLFGMSIDDVHRLRGGAPAWSAAKPGLDKLGEFVRRHKADEGPFVLGSRLSYPDLVIVAFLMSVKRVNEKVFQKIVAQDQQLTALWDACQQYLEMDR